MISVRSDELGSLIIDFSQEPTFNLDIDGVDLQAGLFIKRRLHSLLVVDDTGRPRSVVEYIKSVLGMQGYEVAIDPILAGAIENIATEESLAGNIRTGSISGRTFGDTPTL